MTLGKFVPFALSAAGLGLAAFGFWRLKPGDIVIVSTNSMQPAMPKDRELYVEVVEIKGDTVHGKLTGAVLGLLKSEGIGFGVSFRKSDVLRRV